MSKPKELRERNNLWDTCSLHHFDETFGDKQSLLWCFLHLPQAQAQYNLLLNTRLLYLFQTSCYYCFHKHKRR